MILDDDIKIQERVDDTIKLFDTFIHQRKKRYDDIFVKGWRFEFIVRSVKYTDYIYTEYGINVPNMNDVNKEFNYTIDKIYSKFDKDSILPLYI